MPTADILITDHVKELMNGGVVTAAVVVAEYFEPESGERHLYIGWDDQSPFWVRRGLVDSVLDDMRQAAERFFRDEDDA